MTIIIQKLVFSRETFSEKERKFIKTFSKSGLRGKNRKCGDLEIKNFQTMSMPKIGEGYFIEKDKMKADQLVRNTSLCKPDYSLK
ncbi:hypothetical protein HPL003_19100 [Paenibacillus terrae HPL-003]|uniref:Uncharacterized protein n=1 Tax=Paenibacillus terrae (strain HPL-003) TaxID=985665 RepID=G7W171_PAETH|nr:hypothetical protein HPL003_19100 [Paenibacillus terrae HPL-003]